MQLNKKRSSHFILDVMYLMFVVMSYIFWQERIINQDTAFTSFNLTVFQNFDIAHYRFTDVFTQIIPIGLSKLGFGLKTILVSYSLALALLPYLLFRYVLYNLQDKGIAWLMFLVQMLLVSEYFFDAISQSKIAMALTLLTIAWFKNKRTINKKWKYYLTGFILICITLVSHPISFPLLLIGFVWLWANNTIPIRSTLFFTIGLIIVFYIKQVLLPSSGYESNFISKITNIENINSLIQENYVLTFLKAKFNSIYFIGVLLFVILFFRLIKYNERKMAFVYLLCNLGLFAVMLITFKQGESNMMMEKNLSTLAFTILLPFIGTQESLWLPLKSFRIKLMLPLLSLFFLHRIHKAGIEYTYKQEMIAQLVETARTQGHKKYLIHSDDLKNTAQVNIWSLPFETLLQSSLNGPQGSISIKNINEVDFWRGFHNKTDAFIGPDFFMPYNQKQLPENLYYLGNEKYYLLKVNQ